MKRRDLKKKLRVVFKDEPGIDLGGVSKEWFFLLIQKFFKPDYGMIEITLLVLIQRQSSL